MKAMTKTARLLARLAKQSATDRARRGRAPGLLPRCPMTHPPAATLVDFVLGLSLASAGQGSDNRFSLEGLSLGRGPGGALEIRIASLSAAALRVVSGPLLLEVEHLALHGIVALVHAQEGRPRLHAWQAAGAELSGVKLQGALGVTPPAGGGSHVVHVHGAASAAADAGRPAAGPWCLDPLASANGTIRAEILDAHLLFDADVTVPVREGLVDFNAATVEHVGPDSRMGASRLGFYVDAPNGRSYLYQFPAAPAAGVEYEQRGAMLGARVTDRGRLRLQAFGEAVLRQRGSAIGAGLTGQARQLLDRTAISGELRLGDGRFCVPGMAGELAGSGEGRNAVRLQSQAVGRGLALDMAALSVRGAVLGSTAPRIACDEIAGALALRLSVQDAPLRLAFEIASMKITGLRLLADA